MKKILTAKDLFSLAFGSIIGWGAFVLPGNFFLPDAGVINTLIGFTIAVVMIIFIEKCYSIVMKIHPGVGGEYTFAIKAFGNKVGFITGWLLLLAYISIIPLNATAVPLILDSIFESYSRGVLLYYIAEYPVYQNDLLISLSFIVAFTLINLKGLRSSSVTQNACVFSLLISLIILSIGLFFNIDDVAIRNFKSNLGVFDLNLIVGIIAFAPWAFIGFDTIAQMSDEYDLKEKQASFSAIIAVVFGAIVYNFMNIFTAFGIENNAIDSFSWATGKASLFLLGPVSLVFLSFAMSGSVISGLNGFFISSTRLLFAIYKDNTYGVIHNEIPSRIVLFIGVITLGVPFFGRNALSWFVDLSSVAASFAYLVTGCAALKYSHSVKSKVISIIGICCSFLFLFFLLTPYFNSSISTVSILCLILWFCIGWGVYMKFCRSNFIVAVVEHD